MNFNFRLDLLQITKKKNKQTKKNPANNVWASPISKEVQFVQSFNNSKALPSYRLFLSRSSLGNSARKYKSLDLQPGKRSALQGDRSRKHKHVLAKVTKIK